MDRGVDLLAPGEDVLTCGVSCWDQKIEKFDYRGIFRPGKMQHNAGFLFLWSQKKRCPKKMFFIFFVGGVIKNCKDVPLEVRINAWDQWVISPTHICWVYNPLTDHLLTYWDIQVPRPNDSRSIYTYIWVILSGK